MSIVCGEFGADGEEIVIVALRRPATRSAGLIVIPRLAGAIPDVRSRRTQGWLADAVQSSTPAPTLVMVAHFTGGAAPPPTTANVSDDGDTSIAGASATFSVTSRLRGSAPPGPSSTTIVSA